MALQQNETVSITLKIQGDEARNKLAILEKETRDLEKALKEVPKGSKEWSELNQQLNKNTMEQKKLREEVGVTGLTYKQLQKEVRTLSKEISNMTPGTTDFIEKSKRLQEVEGRMKQVGKEMKGVSDGLDEPNKKGMWGKMSSGFTSISSAASAFMALQLVQVVLGWGKAIFDITGKFERYEKVLTNALGSEKEAQESMKALQQLASKTTFSVDELTDGYQKMVNRGIRPTKAEMVSMADLAASQGKTFDQLVEAALDAQTGEFERLKEFGIRASKSGDQVTFAFKGMQKTVANTPEAIGAAIDSFGQMEGVAGANAKMMETLEGKSSNLGDSFDALQVEIGQKLRPVFVFFLDALMIGIEVIRGVVNVISSVIVYTKNYWTVLYNFAVGAGGVLSNLGSAIKEFLSGNFDAAKEAWDNTKKAAEGVMSGVKEGVLKAKDEIVAIWKNPDAEKEAELAGKIQGQKHQDQLTDAQKKAGEKREKATSKTLELIAQLEAEHNELVSKTTLESEENKIQEKKRKRLKEVEDSLADEKTKEKARALINRNADAEIFQIREKDNKKALELLAQLEAEHDQKVADSSLKTEELKIEEKKRKRLKEVEDSKADEETKQKLILAINRNATAELEKLHADYNDKKVQAELFIIEQERKAVMSHFDWREMQAKGNATKLAAIHKERIDTELQYQKDQLEKQLEAEKLKATKEIADKDQLARAIRTIEERYHSESTLAEAKAAAEKEKIDKALHEKKVASVKAYSDMFSALLKGDLNAFMAGMEKMVQGHQEAWQKKLQKDMEMYEMGANMAMQAVAFLNNLAQQKADRAIAQARREYDEKMGILNTEMAVTESLITSNSNYIQNLKENEKNRLVELQRILSSETASEEEKRQALKQFYSQQFQAMKEAEEQKIMDLQRMANLAKTEDEKRAIEEKIRLAEEERDAKIKAAEEELEAKKKSIDELSEFTTETTEAAVKEATEASEKKVTIAEDEAATLVTNKEELEYTMAEEARKYRAKEAEEKKKAWAAQKKADIATALITGALAILKALANFFPLNIVLAAVAGVTTAIQIGQIKNQPEPNFSAAHGGFVPQGGRHGHRYGDGGIALIDRASGQEVGEMEGDEAIISRDQTEANWPMIQQMFTNARTPGKAKTSVSPASFAQGGMFESPYWTKSMYLFGTKKKKREAEEMAKKAEADAMASAEAAAAAAASAAGGGGEGFDINSAEAQAAYEESRAQGEQQLELLEAIGLAIEEQGGLMIEAMALATDENGKHLAQMGTVLMSVKASVDGLRGAIDGVRGAVLENVGATRGVEGAVWGTNANGILGGIMERISALK